MMRLAWPLAALVLAAGPALAFPGGGPTVCAPRKTVVDNLARDYAEVPAGRGLTVPSPRAPAGALLELLVSPSGSWSLLVTLANGQSCLLAAGEHWEAVDPPLRPGEPL